MSEPVSRDDTLVIYLRDGDVDNIRWRSPDGTEMSAFCGFEVVKDGQEKCDNCGEFTESVCKPRNPDCKECLEEQGRLNDL